MAGGLAALAADSQSAASAGGSTATESIILANRAALDLLVAGHAVTLAADSVAAEPWTVYDDAVAARDRVSSLLASLVAWAPVQPLLVALEDVRATLVASVSASALDLPRLRTLDVPRVVPAEWLAYALYQDSRRADEIRARNAIADPMAIVGPVRVLTR